MKCTNPARCISCTLQSTKENRMRSAVTFLILAACLGAVAAASPAQPPKGKKGDPKGGQSAEAMAADIIARMMAFDKNKDGKLTRDEITDPRLLRLFDRADANKDGVVTQEELIALAARLEAQEGGPGGFGRGPGGFGPPGGGPGGPRGRGGMPQPGQVLPTFLQEQLRLTDDQ